MRKCTKIWTTREGKKIRVCDMTTSHLESTIKMLRDKALFQHGCALHEGYALLGCLHGEMAIESVENDLLRLEEDGYEALLPEIYYDMRTELSRRIRTRPAPSYSKEYW